MIDKKLVDRINYLANKSKNEGLTEEERNEQVRLRQEYLKLFREGFKQRLDSIKIVKEHENDEGN